MEEIKINKLEVEDGWTLWKFQIKVMLRAGGLWELVSGAVTKPEADGEPRKQWIKDDAKAQKILVVSMGEAPLMHVINCETAAAMFATLESVYEQKSDTSIHLLQQQFFQYVKSAEDSIAMHIAKLQKIARQLEDLGEKISENMLVTKILMTLPEQYNHFFAAWEATEKKDRTLKMLTARLCMEESRLGVQPNTQGAFVANQVKGKGDNKKKGKCFICKKFGHWKRDCPNRESVKKLAHGNAFVSEVMFVQSNISRESSWYMDSGASDHMSYRKEWFHDYVKFDTPKDVRIADGSIVQAYGRGDIHVEAYNGNVWNAKYLADVLYVPGIKMNLFSSNACLDKGYSLIAEGNDCYFKKQGKECLQGLRENSKLFKLLLKVNGVEAQANFSAKSESLQLWHERMCHQAKDHVKSVLTQRSISFNSNDFFCEGCVFGKQHRMPFHESKNRANSRGELVHTYLRGPMKEISYGGTGYMLLFCDDFSNYRCVYCIKSKADVALFVERFLDKAEAETRKRVR